MKYWDYNDFEGSLEDAIQRLVERGKTINCVTILKYAENPSPRTKIQMELFPTRALIIYN